MTSRSLYKAIASLSSLEGVYDCSHQILLASCISLGIIVTCLAWIVHKLVSSNRPTIYASMASCKAPMALAWNQRSVLKSWVISRMRRATGSFLHSSSVDFWYLRISRKVTVPGLYLWGFFTPPVALFHGAFCPKDIVLSTSFRAALLPIPVLWRGMGLMGWRGCFPACNASFSFFVSFFIFFVLTILS